LYIHLFTGEEYKRKKQDQPGFYFLGHQYSIVIRQNEKFFAERPQ
jgi:hypothetical protein